MSIRARLRVWAGFTVFSALATLGTSAQAQRVLLSTSREPASTSLVDLSTGTVSPFSSDFTENSVATSDGEFVLRRVTRETRWRIRHMTSGAEFPLPFDFVPVVAHPRQSIVFGLGAGGVPARLDDGGLTAWPVCGTVSAGSMRVSFDGQRLFILCDQVVAVDTVTGSATRTTTVGAPGLVFDFVLDRDETSLVVVRVANGATEFARLNSSTGQTIAATLAEAGPVVSTPTREAIVQTSCRTVIARLVCSFVVRDAATFAEVRRFTTNATFNRVVVSPDERHAYLNSFESHVSRATRLDFLTGAVLDGPLDVFGGQLTMGVAFTPLPPALGPPQVSGPSVTLTWTLPAHSPDVTSYVLEVGSQPGAANLAVVPLGRTGTLAASGVPPNRYYVWVRAVNANGLSPPSNEIVVDVP